MRRQGQGLSFFILGQEATLRNPPRKRGKPLDIPRLRSGLQGSLLMQRVTERQKPPDSDDHPGTRKITTHQAPAPCSHLAT